MGGVAMTGFSPAWLSLREPADRAARNTVVLAACAATFEKRDSIAVCDLGAGTGASVRAFADMLPARQHWTLVDHDAGNLAAATAALSVWADSTKQSGSRLVLTRGAKRIEITTRLHDLAAEPRAWATDTDLVTVSALIDLTSAAWIARFVDALKRDRMPLLATLTANGTITSEPPHASDAAVIASFRTHQTRDKGFGPSAGADAARVLEDALQIAGSTVTAGDSPWVLTDPGLRQTTVDDMAAAVAETGNVPRDDLAQWQAHTRNAQRLTVGHRDVFARFT